MNITASRNFYKYLSTSNPISSNIFCADPSGIEYEDRLYIYGTNDNQQFKEEGLYGKNEYNKIKSLVCFSTDDLINWTYHGEIKVNEIAPWILNAWAPVVIYRKEDDGQNHFYLYFSNNGCGVGVLTATSPLGPWTDPLGKAMVSYDTPDLIGCPNPFDPGACIDDKGDGYLVFGGGYAQGHDDAMPGSARIVKLGKDLISFDSPYVEIPAPYFFESSEIQFINGVYLYSYNNNWIERKEWNYPCEKPSDCSMSYMTTKTPLDSKSWIYQHHYFKNPGEQGLNYSNNHTSLVKYQNQWYILYHTLTLQENTPVTGGFRSICIDKVLLDDSTEGFVSIDLTTGTRKGVSKLRNLNPYECVVGTCMFSSAEIDFQKNDISGDLCSVSCGNGAWFLVKNVDFNYQPCQSQKKALYVEVFIKDFEILQEKPCIEIKIDKVSNPAIAVFNLFDETESENIKSELKMNILKICTELSDLIDGLHDVFFVFSHKNIGISKWGIK